MNKDLDFIQYGKLIMCLDNNGSTIFQFINYDEKIEDVLKKIDDEGIYKVISIFDVSNRYSKIDTFEPISKRALDYAIKMHSGQYRKGGLEYITHPIKVAEYVSKFKESHNIDVLRAASYLHDTLEDTNATYYDLVNKFGPEVASIVLELTTDKELKNLVGKTNYLKIKMKNMSSWALVIKLCDRLDNVSDLMERDEKFRNKYVEETTEILNYLINNRILSGTHIAIIKQILSFIKKCNVQNKEVEPVILDIDRKVKQLTYI